MENILAVLSGSSGIYVYLMIILLLLAGAFAFPFPEDMVFLAAGYLSYKGAANPHIAIIVGLIGLAMGDSIIYFLGNKLGLKIFSLKLFKFLISKKGMNNAKNFMDKNGSKSVFISKFIVGLRYSVFFSSGMFNIGYKRFISFDMLASCITVPTLVYIAYFNGHRIDGVMHEVKRIEYQILGVFVLVMAVFLVRKYVKKLQERKLAKKA